MSNLFKSTFVTFSADDKRIIRIDQNDSRIINPDIREKDDNEELTTYNNENLLEDLELDALIKKRDTQIKKTPEQIIEEAKNIADNIIAEANKQAAQLKALAYEEGKEEGYQEGYGMGSADAEAIINRAEEQLIKTQKECESKLLQLEPKIAEIIISLVHKITGVLLEEKKELILNLINNAMFLIDSSRQILIKVSEEDYSYLIENKDKIYGALNPSITIEIFEDNQLAKGQCIIETDSGIINSSLDVQLSNLITDLKMLANI